MGPEPIIKTDLMEVSLGMGFFYQGKLPGAEMPAKNLPKLFPQSGIFLSGCKDTFCKGNW
jgi:hypothetical protein